MKLTILSLWANKLFRPDDPQPFGGAELQLYLLARHLAREQGVQVHFITRGQGAFEQYEHQSIQVWKLPYRTSAGARARLGFWETLRACTQSETDIYLQRGGGIETAIVAWAAGLKKKPFLFMTSSLLDVDGTHEHCGWLFGLLYRHGLRRAAAVITQTQAQRDLLLQRTGRDSEVLMSSHEIPESIPEKTSEVLWIGRCDDYKNPEAFLDLVEALPQVAFTMVCPLANSREKFERISQRAARLPNLVFSPGALYEETEQLFARHRVSVNTSIQEGFPNTYVQSFKWGTPVVASIIDPDGILESHRLGIRTGTGTTAMARAVERLLGDQPVWREYSANARAYAEAHHDIRKNAARLHAILGRLIGVKQGENWREARGNGK
ncbi:MAG: glycosyltransferase family 4 protein [bacterium]